MTTLQSAFAELMTLAGREVPDFVRFACGAPALATRFAADEIASAAIAAGAVAAADLWTLRSGATQDIHVNTREAAAGLNGFLYQQFEDPARAPERLGQAALARTAANGFKPTKDGRHIYLHPSFPESTKTLLHVLDCDDTPDAVEATCLRWNALDLENAVAIAGACAAMARSPEEWDSSEQGRVIASRPVVEVIQIGESPAEPVKAGDMPLAGFRVLDLTRVLAGPTCARTLAQYGAETMVVSSPNLPSVPFFVTDTGHGKLACFIDLRTEAGHAVLRDLIRSSDVFSQGYRQGALERLGFGPLELAHMRPGIICTAINCYGHEGPWRGRPGWEQLGQTVTGLAHLHGGEAGPQLLPGAVTDYTTGYLAAFGSMVALKRRALYGGSYLVRVSLVQTAVWLRSFGLASPERLSAVEPLSGAEIASFCIRSDSGFGPINHLRPAVAMSATPPRWLRPVVPLGTHEPRWPGGPFSARNSADTTT